MMNSAVRGKSAAHAIDHVGHVGGAAPDERRHPGRRGERPTRCSEVGDQRASLVAVRAIAGRQRERRQVAAGGGGQRGLHVAVARPVRVGVEQGVLLQGQALVDVDQAVHARDARVRREASRPVVEGRQVGRISRRAVGPDGDHDRRELALAELGLEPVEGRARGDGRRQDRRVRGVEPDVQERRAEHEQEEQGRDEHGDRVAHDPPREAGPGTVRPARPVGSAGRRRPAQREAIDARSEDRQDRRQERQRRSDGKPDHDRAGDPDRAQDHELEEDQPQQPEEHGQPAEEDRPAGRGNRHPDRLRHPVRSLRPERELLAEPARQQQRVVDAEAQAEEGREVEHEDAHRADRRDQEDAGQGDDDGRPAHGERHASRHHRPEDHDQGQCGERQ